MDTSTLRLACARALSVQTAVGKLNQTTRLTLSYDIKTHMKQTELDQCRHVHYCSHGHIV